MGYLLVFGTTRCRGAEFTRHTFDELLSNTFSLLLTLRRQIALDMVLNGNLQVRILHQLDTATLSETLEILKN